MFIREQIIRKARGKSYTYYSLVESVRDGNNVHKNVLANFGALSRADADKLARRFAQIAGRPIAEDQETESEIVGFKYFGIPLFVERMLEELKLEDFFHSVTPALKTKFDLFSAFKVMLCAHLFKSDSRAELSVWDWQQKLFWHPHLTADLEYHQLLRALHILVGLQPQLEEHLHARLVDLFSVNVDLVFYDLTSSYVEGHASWSELLQRGYSRDKRSDCKQIVIGLVVTQEGFPVSWKVFEGNRLDLKTLAEMTQELQRRFQIRRCTWVSDAGLLSKENLALLRQSGYDYILGAGSGTYKEVKQFLHQPELQWITHQEMKVAEGKVKLPPEETTAPGQRVILIDSDGRRQKTAAILERRLQRVRDGFEALKRHVANQYYQTREEIRIAAEKVLHNSRVTKYFAYEVDDRRFDYREHHALVEAQKDHAGRYVLLTSSTLDLAEIIGAYRTLLTVEDAFRVMKSELDLRPLWHKCDVNVEGHVLLCVCSYLLFKMLDMRLLEQALPTTPERALQAIKEIRAVGIEANGHHRWKLMKIPRDILAILEAIGFDDPKETFAQWAASAPAYKYQRRLWPHQQEAMKNRTHQAK